MASWSHRLNRARRNKGFAEYIRPYVVEDSGPITWRDAVNFAKLRVDVLSGYSVKRLVQAAACNDGVQRLGYFTFVLPVSYFGSVRVVTVNDQARHVADDPYHVQRRRAAEIEQARQEAAAREYMAQRRVAAIEQARRRAAEIDEL